MSVPGMLYGFVLRSPHAHARINRIDAARALALDGVKAVLTSADLPDYSNGDQGLHDVLGNVMARRKALYDGHPVAAVAAVSPAIARKALGRIDVEYEVLPHVTDVEAAMAPDAPILHDHIFTEGVQPKSDKPSNIVARHQFGHGDPAKGFEVADVVIERTFRTEAAHQGYIEPHACLADLRADTVLVTSGAAHKAITWCARRVPLCSTSTSRACG
jgi:CO/xanthine dehydrogenase Mo-binding subunit